MKNLKKMWFAVAIAAVLPLLNACGGNNDSGKSNARYTLGGTVADLHGMLTLQNGRNTLDVYENGSFVFNTTLANGSNYNVTVSGKPLNQVCTVYNGSGTIKSANVTNIRVTCANAAGVTLSGRIAVPSGVIIDGSVNDWNEKYVDNRTFATAQVLPNPISVGGYVNLPGYGYPGRSYYNGNRDDYYQVQLKKGDAITLATGETDTRFNDLDLYLYDSNRTVVDYSTGRGKYEFLVAPSDGVYYVNVYAYNGASNYVLTIGADAAAAAVAAADPELLSSQREIVPGQIIVRFKDTVKTAYSTDRTLAQYAADMGLKIVAGAPEREMLMSIDELKVQTHAGNTGNERQKLYGRNTVGNGDNSGDGDNVDKTRLHNTLQTIKELRQRPDILSAEPNYIVHSYRTVNDAYYGRQWNLPLINLPEAWDVTTGDDNVIVAVVDTGVLINHPDLSGRLTGTGYDFVSKKPGGNDPGDKEPGTARSSFHGTHVAGIIGAATNNTTGVAGVTWNTKIMPVRVMGVGGRGNTYDIMQGMRYAAGLSNNSGTVPPKAADIINLSLGGGSYLSSEQSLIDELRAKGIIVIAAAGNENTSMPSYPAAYTGVIAVSAVNIDSTRASYSNYGSYVDVAAPGGDSGDRNGDGFQDYVLSTCGDDSSGSIVYNYALYPGTSMAAPHVAGVAAMMKAVYPALSPADFDALLATGDITNDIGAPGKDTYYGHGLINAFKAVAAAKALAGGGTIAGLDVNPRTVNFGVFASETTVTASKIGTGEISVTGVHNNAGWLTVTRDTSVNSHGFGVYKLSVDRPSLIQDGTYTDVVTFTTSDGKSVSVNVTVQVRSFVEADYDAGYHYVMLIKMKGEDGNTVDDENTPITQVAGSASGGYYNYAFNNVPPGYYLVIAGSDRNNDDYIGDGGEAFGAYPDVNQTVTINVTNRSITNLDFTTNLLLSIPGVNDAGNMTAADKPEIDKPAVIPPKFRRLW